MKKKVFVRELYLAIVVSSISGSGSRKSQFNVKDKWHHKEELIRKVNWCEISSGMDK